MMALRLSTNLLNFGKIVILFSWTYRYVPGNTCINLRCQFWTACLPQSAFGRKSDDCGRLHQRLPGHTLEITTVFLFLRSLLLCQSPELTKLLGRSSMVGSSNRSIFGE